jgi:hypothetical protein
MALKKGLTDPLNWLLLLLAGAFIYYIVAVPYFTDYYLKTPQSMTMQEYLANPAHPRPFMVHALSAPPAAIEVVLTGLTVVHIDQDSILLEDPMMAPAPPAAPVAEPVAVEGMEGMEGEEVEEPTPAEPEMAPAILEFGPEAAVPAHQILIAGDNLDLLPIQVGMPIGLRVHALHESPLGWVPQELTVTETEEQYFNKDELDELALLKLDVGGNEIPIPYIEVGELRFASSVHPAGEPFTLEELSNDTTYIQTASRLSGGTVDIYGLSLVERRVQDRAPYFVVEDAEGRRAHVFYNQRLLSEWYWTEDRLGEEDLVVRGTMRIFPPDQLRQMEANGNVQAVIDGYALMSSDGSKIINLENPLGGLGLGQ